MVIRKVMADGEVQSNSEAARRRESRGGRGDGVVIRVPKAYPVYDTDYARYFEIVKEYFGRFRNLQLVGRNGQHKYNNQDHSMLTALLAVRNILGAGHDLWSVNTDQEYPEEE